MGSLSTKSSDNLRMPTAASTMNIYDSVNCKSYEEFSQDYIIIRQIGVGAFSKVMLALYKFNSYRVVKVLNFSKLRSQHFNNMCISEFSILKDLYHPNVLKAYDLFTDNINLYLTMEYCEGNNLYKKLIEKITFSEEQAAEVAYQILSGLEYIHSKGIIHRDIKLENILIQFKGQLKVKIADFGNSCIAHDKIKGNYGTSYYLAPEVLNGYYSEKVDIWSLGIVLYILVKGKMPYRKSINGEIKEQVKSSPFQVKDELFHQSSRLFIDFLKGLVKINPSERFSASEALSHPWLIINRKVKSTLNYYHILNGSMTCKISLFISAYIILKLVDDFPYILRICSEILSSKKLKEINKEILSEIKLEFNTENFKKTCEKIVNEVREENKPFNGFHIYKKTLTDNRKVIPREILSNIFQAIDKNSDGAIKVNDVKEFFCLSNNDLCCLGLLEEFTRSFSVISFECFLQFLEVHRC